MKIAIPAPVRRYAIRGSDICVYSLLPLLYTGSNLVDPVLHKYFGIPHLFVLPHGSVHGSLPGKGSPPVGPLPPHPDKARPLLHTVPLPRKAPVTWLPSAAPTLSKSWLSYPARGGTSSFRGSRFPFHSYTEASYS